MPTDANALLRLLAANFGSRRQPSEQGEAPRARRRTREDLDHDPPRAVRLQRRAMVHSALAADVAKRCGLQRNAGARSGADSGEAGASGAGAGGQAAELLQRTLQPAVPAVPSALGAREVGRARARVLASQLGGRYLPNTRVGSFSGENRARVYNVSFSRSGNICVAAWQDESIRVYDSSSAPARTEGARAGGWREAARVQARDVAWTVTSTDTSPDEGCVAYSSIHSTVHLLRLNNGGGADGGGTTGANNDFDEEHEEREFDFDNDRRGPDSDEEDHGPASIGHFTGHARASSYAPFATPLTPSAKGASSASPRASAAAGTRTFYSSGAGSGRGRGEDFGITAHEPLDFTSEESDADRSGRGDGSGGGSRQRRGFGRGFGIFSVKFSVGGSELVAGCNDGMLRVMDLSRGVVSDRVSAHRDDVNAVCFAGGSGASSDVIISGSDEIYTPLKVWDRRALGAPVGVLLGHQGGLTHVTPRGDGFTLLSVGKDQALKLWDLRQVSISNGSEAGDGINTWREHDYRFESYSCSRSWHPRDASINTFFGPHIQNTLVRAYFSPLESTGARYIYSGSADGSIYVIDAVSGEIVLRLGGHRAVIRDVAWHPYQPFLVSASWDGELGLWKYTERGALRGAAVAASIRAQGRSVRRRNREARKLVETADPLSSDEESDKGSNADAGEDGEDEEGEDGEDGDAAEDDDGDGGEEEEEEEDEEDEGDYVDEEDEGEGN